MRSNSIGSNMLTVIGLPTIIILKARILIPLQVHLLSRRRNYRLRYFISREFYWRQGYFAGTDRLLCLT